MKHTLTLLTALLRAPLATLHAADKQAQPTRPDIVLADFEQDYGDWTVEGEAFNHPPTRVLPAARQPFAGMVPFQVPSGYFDNIPIDFLPISKPPVGYAGKGLADSWDPSYGNSLQGSLTSPKFTIQRRFILFQIGGARGSLELFIDGKKEFHLEAVGERTLRPWALDVSPFLGREAQLVIRDAGWKSYIAVGEIVAGDSATKGTRIVVHKSQCVVLDKQMNLQGMHYLVMPINYLAPKVECSLEVDGQKKLDLTMRLAIDVPVDFWGSYPLDEAWSGERLRLTSNQPVVLREHGEDFLRQINLATQPRDTVGIYAEPGRPQLHFTVRSGFSYDPLGLFFYEGVWHLFYQCIQLGVERGNEMWGHATSPDLFHWTEQSPANRPGLDFLPFSGGGLVDHNNDSGLKEGVHPPILLFYSQHGRSATALKYSVDGGKTFRQYEKNPLFLTRNPSGHDPKVVWYPKETKWVMAICDVLNGIRGYDFYESKNLRDWKYLSTDRERWSECPDLFPLPLDGDQSKIHWVLHICNHHYQIGDFNGREFIPATPKLMSFHGDHLAGQTFDNAPGGRRILMGALSEPSGRHEPGFQNISSPLTATDVLDGGTVLTPGCRQERRTYQRLAGARGREVSCHQTLRAQGRWLSLPARFRARVAQR